MTKTLKVSLETYNRLLAIRDELLGKMKREGATLSLGRVVEKVLDARSRTGTGARDRA